MKEPERIRETIAALAAALRADAHEEESPGKVEAWDMYECGSCGVFTHSLRDHVCLEPLRAVVFCTGPKGGDRCGRVRLEGLTRWDYRPTAKLDGVPGGLCPTCYAEQLAEQHRRWAKEGRDLWAQRARGFGEAPEGVDVFAGFREKE